METSLGPTANKLRDVVAACFRVALGAAGATKPHASLTLYRATNICSKDTILLNKKVGVRE